MPLKWKKITNLSGLPPRPRHGHRAVAIKELIVIFGGGNNQLFHELHVFNTEKSNWFKPSVKGNIPEGRAAFGIAVEKTRIIIHGGMLEYSLVTDEIYELQASRWEWRKLSPKIPQGDKPPPRKRMGHSFTLFENKIYLFGGLTLDDERHDVYTEYLNDLYILNLLPNNMVSWDLPMSYGCAPSPRESHSAIAHVDGSGRPLLVIFGGMNGRRLNDLWFLELDSMSWRCPETKGPLPLPRSLHSATLVDNTMYVFGGWIPLMPGDYKVTTLDIEWKVTNELICLNLRTMTWENLSKNSVDDVPKPRAGHCAVEINGRIYIWAGRDGYRKAWNNQVCCNDFWYLEIKNPPQVGRPQLLKGEGKVLEINWPPALSAEYYLLQIQKFDIKRHQDYLHPELPRSTEKSDPLFKKPSVPKPKSIGIKPGLSQTKEPKTNSSKELEEQNTSNSLKNNNSAPLEEQSTSTPLEEQNISTPSEKQNTSTPLEDQDSFAPLVEQDHLLKTKMNPQQQINCQNPSMLNIPHIVTKTTQARTLPLSRLVNVKNYQLIGSMSPSVRLRNVIRLANPNSKEISGKTFHTLKTGPRNMTPVNPRMIVCQPKNQTILLNKTPLRLVTVNNDSQIKLVPSNADNSKAPAESSFRKSKDDTNITPSISEIMKNVNSAQSMLIPLNKSWIDSPPPKCAKTDSNVDNRGKKLPTYLTTEPLETIVIPDDEISLSNLDKGSSLKVPIEVQNNNHAERSDNFLNETSLTQGTKCTYNHHMSGVENGESDLQVKKGKTLNEIKKLESPHGPRFPRNCKIKKLLSTGGARITWDPPMEGNVSGYVVKLFVKKNMYNSDYKIVYEGTEPECSINKYDIEEGELFNSSCGNYLKFIVCPIIDDIISPGISVQWVHL